MRNANLCLPAVGGPNIVTAGPHIRCAHARIVHILHIPDVVFLCTTRIVEYVLRPIIVAMNCVQWMETCGRAVLPWL